MRLLLVLAISAVAARAAAHVAPSVGDNNRYIKLTPLGDRIRLAYTVIYGHAPGAMLRKAIDANHDGRIDDTESTSFGGELATQIAAALELTLDGAPRPVAWSQVVVGMGTPDVIAGSFAVDLVAWLCLAPRRGTHTVLLKDHLTLERPGETEIKVEDSPGVKLDHAQIGGDDDLGLEYKIIGPGGPLADEGLDVQFTAGDTSLVTDDATCGAVAPRRELPAGAIATAGAATALVLAGLTALVVRHRRR